MKIVSRRDDFPRATSAALPKRRLAAALMALAVACLPVAAANPAVASTNTPTQVASTLATTSFTDVDPSNQFYNEIRWLAATAITTAAASTPCGGSCACH